MVTSVSSLEKGWRSSEKVRLFLVAMKEVEEVEEVEVD